MKSKKAEEYLNRVYKPGNNSMTEKAYNRNTVDKVIQLAKEEIKAEAIELFCQVTCGDSCPKTSFRCCEKRAKFIDGLNK